MQFSKKITEKLKTLPDSPGVYFMRDRSGRVIYVGKAISLRNRVRHYFQPATLRNGDPKLKSLIKSICSFDFLELKTEEDAALTEGRLIKEYRPRYNIDMKDDKHFLMLKIDTNVPYPRFEFCRFQKQDNATYFGPYASATSARATREFVEREFGLRPCRPHIPGTKEYKHCNNDIIRYCSAPCAGKTDIAQYHERVEEATAFLRAERPKHIKTLMEKMKTAAEKREYEKAAALRDTIRMLRRTIDQKIRAPKTPAIKTKEALAGIDELRVLLNLDHTPHVIECYDISNISGTHSVASMVCAIDGRPRRIRYRRFRIKTVEGADDPRSIAEVIRRRFTRLRDKRETPPDLIVVDGGITQLRAAKTVLSELNFADIPVIGLAKKHEDIIREDKSGHHTLRPPSDSPSLQVLRRLRDEAHRFAITYHRKLRNRRIRESALDDIPGIGEKKKHLILRHFGSIRRLRKTSLNELQNTPGIGPKTAQLLHDHFNPV
jgi:excinuclease ABC subunit C